MSARPAEDAAHQHAADEASMTAGQLRDGGAHHAAVMAGPEGLAVADSTDPRPGPTAAPLATPAAVKAHQAAGQG